MSVALVNAAQPEAAVDLGRHEFEGMLAPLRVFTLRRYAPPSPGGVSSGGPTGEER